MSYTPDTDYGDGGFPDSLLLSVREDESCLETVAEEVVGSGSNDNSDLDENDLYSCLDIEELAQWDEPDSISSGKRKVENTDTLERENPKRIRVDTAEPLVDIITVFTAAADSGCSRDNPPVHSTPLTTPELDGSDDESAPADEPPPWTGSNPEDRPIYLDGGIGPRIQRSINRCPWGVQYMIAYYRSNGALKPEQITASKLEMLQGTNEEMAPRVLEVLRGTIIEDRFSSAYEKERATRCPWAELDREYAALSEDPYALVGGKRQEVPYGGKIVFPVRARKRKDSNVPRFELERPELSSSDGFRREYGSSAFIRLRLGSSMEYKKLGEFLHRPFVLCGRVFRAFRRKDESVFLIEVNEVLLGYDSPPPRYGDNCRPKSFFDFLDSHNPRSLNNKQNAAKYGARFDLKLSNSVVACVLERSNIIFMPEDEISPAANGSSDAKYVMTDGCGYGNRALFEAVKAVLNLDSCPTVVQMRLAGSKGLLILHPGPEAYACSQPQAWLRPSQVKIKYTEAQLENPSRRSLDILRLGHLRTPSRASTEVLIVWSDNGVPATAITAHLQRMLQELTNTLTDFDRPNAMRNLWYQIAKARSVLSQRRARYAAGEARALGLGSYDYVEEDDGDDGGDGDFDPAFHEQSAAWWPDEISGSPSTLEETVMALLDSGFTPACGVLASKLDNVIRSILMNFVKPPRFKIELPMSCTAFITPDPTGTLDPGEIFIRSSHDNVIGLDGIKTDTIIGEVLVKAVYRPALHRYTNQIVISVKGDRSLASILAGGDYDGDKCFVTWDPAIVEPFKNAHLRYADPPDGFEDAFEKNPISVAELEPASIRDWQRYLLALDSHRDMVGIFSKRHTLAIYLYGLRHQTTRFLSHMFAYILDSDKNGKKIHPTTRTKYDNMFRGKGVPKWTVAESEHNRDDGFLIPEHEQIVITDQERERLYKRRDRFIMDEVVKAAHQEKKRCLQIIDNRFAEYPATWDADLLAPWDDAERRSRMKKDGTLESALQAIKEHVKKVAEKHGQQINPKSKDHRFFTKKPITERQDILRGLSKMFHSELQLTESQQLEFVRL
ncbi:hypothetical protein PUNSTDRAFT_44349 [Punctularia strigosozonata HHB-11173 SS5]|uniref:uncharacterized protein n=1 Tax=Punctularia strigosozonata (strain HHB-11173) TaxID=741275 RepID=UPI0004416E0A|nr:uncharacterized protein PUNSTDRAFT_44349 [Punctularia strigosozonata HHB-11173 SS5]EIN08814.1 hypothetical protein PUNSTDRAFT_44349 [Punctularia strigosozonata HHB-11173 SS5]